MSGEDSELYRDWAPKKGNQSFLPQLALSNLHAKGMAELGDIHRLIAEKDAELHAAEGNLDGLMEVHIFFLFFPVVSLLCFHVCLTGNHCSGQQCCGFILEFT
ncbi:hypothetical protein B296_00011179, partial [Ensete ventricosum]